MGGFSLYLLFQPLKQARTHISPLNITPPKRSSLETGKQKVMLETKMGKCIEKTRRTADIKRITRNYPAKGTSKAGDFPNRSEHVKRRTCLGAKCGNLGWNRLYRPLAPPKKRKATKHMLSSRHGWASEAGIAFAGNPTHLGAFSTLQIYHRPKASL